MSGVQSRKGRDELLRIRDALKTLEAPHRARDVKRVGARLERANLVDRNAQGRRFVTLENLRRVAPDVFAAFDRKEADRRAHERLMREIKAQVIAALHDRDEEVAALQNQVAALKSRNEQSALELSALWRELRALKNENPRSGNSEGI